MWFIGAVIGHDLVLMPLYMLADRSVTACSGTGRRNCRLCRGSTTCASPRRLSGMLLLVWFPLIFRIPAHSPCTTDLSLNPYLGHWVAVTGVLFLLSAVVFALRLRPGRHGRRTAGHGPYTAGEM